MTTALLAFDIAHCRIAYGENVDLRTLVNVLPLFIVPLALGQTKELNLLVGERGVSIMGRFIPWNEVRLEGDRADSRIALGFGPRSTRWVKYRIPPELSGVIARLAKQALEPAPAPPHASSTSA